MSGSDAIVWQVNEAAPYVPSPVLHVPKIWVCSSNNEVISCYDAQTGTPHSTKQRIEGLKGVYASPVAVADRVYFAGRNGVTAVIRSSDAFEILATNTLDDGFDASPAIVSNALYLKDRKHLYCLTDR